MSLAAFLTAVFLILFGINTLGIISVAAWVLGLVALVAGIAWLVEGYRPIVLWKRQ